MEVEAGDKSNGAKTIQTINSDLNINDIDGNGISPNVNSELNHNGIKAKLNTSHDIIGGGYIITNENINEPSNKPNESSQEPSYSIMEKLHDIDFRVQFIKMLNNINPNVNWSFELKSISEQHKSDAQIIKLLRSRSWIDQDIEPEYDYSDIFRRIHETFNPIIFEHLESQFNSIDLNPNSTKASSSKLVQTDKPKLRVRILDVDMKVLPPRLVLDMYIWKKCLIDFFTISNVEYEFASPLEYELLGSINGPEEQIKKEEISSQSTSINISTDNNKNEAKDETNSNPNKSYNDISDVDLYRFNFGWESLPSWKESREDGKRIDFIWNGLNPSNPYSPFLRDILISVYTLPSEMEE